MQVYTLNNIQQAFLAAGIVPFNPRIILLKLTSTCLKLPTANILPSEISLSTPRDSGAAMRLIQQTKILLHKDAELE